MPDGKRHPTFDLATPEQAASSRDGAPMTAPATLLELGRPLETLTRLEKAWLKRRVCWLCEMRLDRNACGSMGARCTTEQHDARRGKALASYKPRAALAPTAPQIGQDDGEEG